MKAVKFFFISVLLILLTIPIIAQDKGDINTWKEEIITIEKLWEEALKQEDIDKIMGFFTSDAVLMMPDFPTVRGKDAIREITVMAFDNEGMDFSSYSCVIEDVDVSSSGDLAVVIYSDKMLVAGQVLDSKSLDVFKKINGEWKCTVVINNNTDNQLAGLK